MLHLFCLAVVSLVEALQCVQLVHVLYNYFQQVLDAAGEKLFLNCRVVYSGAWLVLVLPAGLVD